MDYILVDNFKYVIIIKDNWDYFLICCLLKIHYLGSICKGICTRHEAKVIGDASNTRYASGQKRCQNCEIYMNWNYGNNCPSCGCKLRTRPRQKKLKKMFKEIETEKKNIKRFSIE